jgi:hypothetical protein
MAPARRINPLLRVMFSVVLLAFAIFVVVYKKSTAPTKTDLLTPSKPFLTDSPSSEGANRFAWVPKYPGATTENISSKQTRDELTYGFNFHSPDDFKKVLAYYRDQLQSAGFQVDLKENTTAAGELHAATENKDRTFDAVVANVSQGTGSEVGVTAIQHQ